MTHVGNHPTSIGGKKKKKERGRKESQCSGNPDHPQICAQRWEKGQGVRRRGAGAMAGQFPRRDGIAEGQGDVLGVVGKGWGSQGTVCSPSVGDSALTHEK